MLSAHSSTYSKEVKPLPYAHYSVPYSVHDSFSVIFISSVSITLAIVVIIFMLVIIVYTRTELLLVDHPPGNVPVLSKYDDWENSYVDVREAEERNKSYRHDKDLYSTLVVLADVSGVEMHRSTE